jgi:RHS repeat-associated protein
MTAHFTGTQGTPDSTTAYYMGGAYEVKDSAVKKYYSIAGQTIAMNDGGGLKYLLTDHLGSSSAVVNQNGTLLSQQRYLPFGEVRTDTNPPYITQTDLTYTGQRVLPDIGLMDYRARFYSVSLGRFIQPDSIIQNPGNPQNLNRFSYVVNRPLNFVDPSGHIYLCDEGCEEGLGRRQYTLNDMADMYGVSFNSGWSVTNKAAALLGIYKIAKKLQKVINSSLESAHQDCVDNMSTPTSTCAPANSVTAAQAFTGVYGTGLKFEWVDGVCGIPTDRCYADANSFPKTIKFYSKFWAGEQNQFVFGTPPVTSSLAIHELGHAFDVRTNRAFNQALINKGITGKIGFGTIIGADGQHEVTADLFTNYILGTFTGPGIGGVNLPQFMDENMASWVNIASTP